MASKPKSEAQKFPAEELIKAAPAVFGVSPEMMAGALHGTNEASKDEAEALLKKFQDKGVK